MKPKKGTVKIGDMVFYKPIRSFKIENIGIILEVKDNGLTFRAVWTDTENKTEFRVYNDTFYNGAQLEFEIVES